MIPVAETARMIGVHRTTLKRSIPPRELPYVRVGKRHDRRYRVSDVMAYLDRRRVD
jgi:excisionase family DNA binding protein